MSKRCNIIIAIGLFLLFGFTGAKAQWEYDGVPVSTESLDQNCQCITHDDAGGAIIVWSEYESGNHDLYAQKLDSNGVAQWTPRGVAVCTLQYHHEFARIIPDGSGGAIITWRAGRGGDTGYDIYAQRIDSLGFVLWIAGGVAVCTAPYFQEDPAITSDGAGGAIITWHDERDGSYDDIYAQRVDAGGTVQWTTDGVAICTAAGIQTYPGITADGYGGAIISWENWLSPKDGVSAQRIDASGAVQWTPDGVTVCACPILGQPNLVSDGVGGAIITWRDYVGGHYDVHAQRVDASGAVQWVENGVAICTDTMSVGDNPQIIQDGAGGAIITWMDYGYGDDNIRAQKIDADGVVLWTVNGVSVCTDTMNQQMPRIVSDGAGGAIITWQDDRGGGGADPTPDIYAQRIDASGSSSWNTNGIPICTAIDMQFGPKIATDGRGGAIIAWSDKRDGKLNIYALRVDHDGNSPPTHVDHIPCSYYLSQNYPNPFNPTTTIRFDLPHAMHVKLDIYNVKGELVATLVDRHMTEGRKEVAWTARNSRGRAVTSGIYFYRLAAGDFVQTRKMALLR